MAKKSIRDKTISYSNNTLEMSLNEEKFINVLNDIEKSRYNKSLNEINYRDVRQEEYTLAIETIDRENREFDHNYEAILKESSRRI